MFKTQKINEIQYILDQFTVPMFLVERSLASSQFHFSYLNQAFETASGITMSEHGRLPLIELLPASQARDLAKQFEFCTRQQTPLRILETLTLPAGTITWDMSLQHIALPSGDDRIIGTAFQLADVLHDCHNKSEWEDIRYFASLSDLQLQNLVSVFESADNTTLCKATDRARVTHLAGICRSVQQSIKDIQRTVTKAQTGKRRRVIKSGSQAGGTTLQALFSLDQD